jgi:hypothetical protein
MRFSLISFLLSVAGDNLTHDTLFVSIFLPTGKIICDVM